MNKKFLVLALFFFGFACFSSYFFVFKRNVHSRDVDVVVFVHGAISLGALAPLTHFFQFMNDRVTGTEYEQVITNIRQDLFFRENQPMKECGLCAVDYTDLQSGNAAEGFAALYHTIGASNRNDAKTLFYTFGWHGAFSRSVRVSEARALYDALKSEITKIKNQGLSPRITTIGYCHGAHVILEMAQAFEDDQEKIHDFLIEKVVCIGMPKSSTIDQLIASSLFKKIYSIFSTQDRVQPIDIFVSGKLLTDRMLPATDSIKEKVVHVEVRVFKYLGKKDIHNHPNFLESEHMLGKKMAWRNQSPGHTEFWFFSWTPGRYRQDWIFPIPLVSCLPCILDLVEKYESHFTQFMPIVVDIRPEFDTVLLRQKYEKTCYVESFKLNNVTIQDILEKVMPQIRKTQREYNERLAFHKKRASELFSEQVVR